MYSNARAAYMDASVSTASPARLLVMLYERLVLDLRRGLEAQQAGDVERAHRELLHAQDIVLELRHSLKVDQWDGGPAMASLYDYMHTQLVRANVGKDPVLTTEVLGLATELCTAWREAALASLDTTLAG